MAPAATAARSTAAVPMARLDDLFEPGTTTVLPGDDGSGVVSARGRLEGTAAIAFATDPERMGGAMGVSGCARIVAAIDAARTEGVPVVGIWHSGGARLDEGVEALHAVGEVFAAMVRASGRVPQISVVLGPAAGGAAYGPALTDIVIMSDSGRIFVTGPRVVRSVTGEQVGMESLGGPEPHSRRSGVAHLTLPDEAGALRAAGRLAGLLGDQGQFEIGNLPDRADPGSCLPARANRAYDVKPLVALLLDGPDGSDPAVMGEEATVELQPRWAPNMVTALGRLAGRTVGVLANNPLRLCGCLDAASADKGARFVRLCDALGVPLVVVVDVPGYLPGVAQEWDGVVRRGAKLLHAFAESVVPSVTVVTRKAYGGAFIAMNSRSLGAAAVFTWPTAAVGVMGAGSAVDILHRRTLEGTPTDERPALHDRLVEEHEHHVDGVRCGLAAGVLDEVIAPATTRTRLARTLAEAPAGRGRHTNIPL